MKKLAIFIFLILLLCCTNLNVFKTFTLDTLFPDATVEVYVDGEGGEIDNLNYITNGSGKIVFINISELKLFINSKRVIGYTIKIDNMQINDVFKAIKVKNVDFIQGAYYGDSDVFDKQLNLNGVSYNFECVKQKNCILLGTPILLGSY